jgi:hypothetical protein
MLSKVIFQLLNHSLIFLGLFMLSVFLVVDTEGALINIIGLKDN